MSKEIPVQIDDTELGAGEFSAEELNALVEEYDRLATEQKAKAPQEGQSQRP